jgi:hypothetical protein
MLCFTGNFPALTDVNLPLTYLAVTYYLLLRHKFKQNIIYK